MVYDTSRRKVFISHYKGDLNEVNAFIKYFAVYEKVFIPYILGANDSDILINSAKTDYVMQQIRRRYLQDTTVTIVLVGRCTHSRRYVDWEIKSSLRQGQGLPNGLVGIILPSQGKSAYLPPRFEDNWDSNSGYARYYIYPPSVQKLKDWIEDAHAARKTRANMIKNSQDMMSYNMRCRVCQVTH